MKLSVARWQEKEGNELTANGLIRKNPNKPEFGSIMLISRSASVTNGFVNMRNKVGFLTGEVEVLETLIKNYSLREGSDYSAQVSPHRIVTIEKTADEMTEADLGYREKINPSTGEVLTKDGEVIFWKTEVVSEGSNVQDKLIQHDTEPVEDVSQAEFTQAENLERK